MSKGKGCWISILFTFLPYAILATKTRTSHLLFLKKDRKTDVFLNLIKILASYIVIKNIIQHETIRKQIF